MQQLDLSAKDIFEIVEHELEKAKREEGDHNTPIFPSDKFFTQLAFVKGKIIALENVCTLIKNSIPSTNED